VQNETKLKGRTMIRITQSERMPVDELSQAARSYLAPLLRQLPDKRLRVVGVLMVLGILAGQSPLITQIARGVRDGSQYIMDMARRLYRFVWNSRLSYQTLQSGLYAIGQASVACYGQQELVVAIDPVNFEKPYTHELEGVSTVHKSSPPDRAGQARLVRGYPALTACVVNLPEPVLTYAQWFSYTREFLSENAELMTAMTNTRRLYPDHALCFVADSGLDDQKLFAHVQTVNATFIIRVKHEERLVDVWNEHLQRFERETVGDLIATMPPMFKLETTFTHARKTRTVRVSLGWLRLHLPNQSTPLWLLAIHDPDLDRDYGLLTNRPIATAADAQAVFVTWRYRPDIEHTYRLDQEAGLDVEDLRVHTLEHMRRVFLMVLVAAAFLYHLDQSWQPEALHWLRSLGGKLGALSDLDGLYLLLAGIAAVLSTAATLTFVRANPFPRLKPTCG
jgi:hypothetical protein